MTFHPIFLKMLQNKILYCMLHYIVMKIVMYVKYISANKKEIIVIYNFLKL